VPGIAHFLRANAPWLAAGFLLTFGSSFGQTFFIAVFAGEIRAAFGLTHGSWGAIYALATTASAAVMVYAGSLTDRFRVRYIGLAVILGLICAALLMSVITEVWMLLGVLFLLRLFGQGLMGHSAMVAMARWFVATRGRAVSVAGLGVATGEALLPITFVALLGVFDWRMLWVVAAMALCVLMPILWGLLRRERTPQSFTGAEGSAGMGGRMWHRGEVLRHPLFWLMIPALLGPAGLEHRLLLSPGPPGRGEGLGACRTGGAVSALHRDERRLHADRRRAGRPVRQHAARALLPAAAGRRLPGLRAVGRNAHSGDGDDPDGRDAGRACDDDLDLLGRCLRHAQPRVQAWIAPSPQASAASRTASEKVGCAWQVSATSSAEAPNSIATQISWIRSPAIGADDMRAQDAVGLLVGQELHETLALETALARPLPMKLNLPTL
jgi:hypothetical protein